ncbi:programmed cell death protein 7 [Drosophila biarmipes]|uniref:programmed cell death protein 7 n=1 Tax=Drosophila biarmipes TaxID=125945 RepID=UPI0007E87582|nr:programmed cell death protein 7 [Drosophila biarmipes]
MDNKQNIKLSEIKASIQHVLANLEQLEQLSCEAGQDFDGQQAEELQRRTSTLLDELEKVPAERVADIQKQRKRRRRLDKEKKKRFKKKAIKCEIREKKYTIEPPRIPQEKQAEHISLRKRRDAASILETLDLLEKLCESRGGDKAALNHKLTQMRRVWRRVQEENKDDQVKESKKAASIESQWEAVLFGKPSPLIRGSKGKFLEIRSTWDSYISFACRGSYIPRGWVLPPLKPSAQWAAYRTDNQ